ncbi:MAG: hypothetical protein OSB03_14890, partial [Vicinamibacterales bacterium]|nr:hypothetical protein [Vicinamibacterales bacterium]
ECKGGSDSSSDEEEEKGDRDDTDKEGDLSNNDTSSQFDPALNAACNQKMDAAADAVSSERAAFVALQRVGGAELIARLAFPTSALASTELARGRALLRTEDGAGATVQLRRCEGREGTILELALRGADVENVLRSGQSTLFDRLWPPGVDVRPAVTLCVESVVACRPIGSPATGTRAMEGVTIARLLKQHLTTPTSAHVAAATVPMEDDDRYIELDLATCYTVAVVSCERDLDCRDLDAGAFDCFCGVQGEPGAIQRSGGDDQNERTSSTDNSAAKLWSKRVAICQHCEKDLRLRDFSRPPRLPRRAVANNLNLGWLVLEEIALQRRLGHLLGDPGRALLPHLTMVERSGVNTERVRGATYLKIVPPGREGEQKRPIWTKGIKGNFVSLKQASVVAEENSAQVAASGDADDVQVVFAAARCDVEKNRRFLEPLRLRRDVLNAWGGHYRVHGLVNQYQPCAIDDPAPPVSLVDGLDRVTRNAGSAARHHVPDRFLDNAIYSKSRESQPDTAYATTSKSALCAADKAELDNESRLEKGAVVTVAPPADGGVERMGVIVDPDVDLDGAHVRVRFANEEEETVSVELVQTAGGMTIHASGSVAVDAPRVDDNERLAASLQRFRADQERVGGATVAVQSPGASNDGDDPGSQAAPVPDGSNVFVHRCSEVLSSDFHSPSTTQGQNAYQYPWRRGGPGNFRYAEKKDAFEAVQGRDDDGWIAEMFCPEPIHRPEPIGDNNYVERGLQLYGGLFDHDLTFLLRETNKCQRREVLYSTMRIPLRTVDRVGGETLDSLLIGLEQEVQARASEGRHQAERARRGDRPFDPAASHVKPTGGGTDSRAAARELRRGMQYGGGTQMCSPIQRYKLQSAFFATIAHRGAQDVFITISPSDVNDVRISKIASPDGAPTIHIDVPATWPGVFERQKM